jgi:hypothetical protein
MSRSRVDLKGPHDLGWRRDYLFPVGEGCLLPHCAWISYRMMCSVLIVLLAIVSQGVVLGCRLEVIATMAATTRLTNNNVMPVCSADMFGHYNNAVAVIDGYIQKADVGSVALLIFCDVLCNPSRHCWACYYLSLRPFYQQWWMWGKPSSKVVVQRRLVSRRPWHQEDLLIATTLDIKYAPMLVSAYMCLVMLIKHDVTSLNII